MNTSITSFMSRFKLNEDQVKKIVSLIFNEKISVEEGQDADNQASVKESNVSGLTTQNLSIFSLLQDMPFHYVMIGSLFMLYMIYYMSNILFYLIGVCYPLLYTIRMLHMNTCMSESTKNILRYWIMMICVVTSDSITEINGYAKMFIAYVLISDSFRNTQFIYDKIVSIMTTLYDFLSKVFMIESNDISSRKNN